MISHSTVVETGSDQLCQRKEDGIHRLDFLVNPYAPSPAVSRAIVQSATWNQPSSLAADILLDRLALRYGLAPAWFRCEMNYRAMQRRLLIICKAVGSLALFPGGEASLAEEATGQKIELVQYPQAGRSFINSRLNLEHQEVVGAAWVQSPGDPSGEMIGIQALVQLCRQTSVVIVDERHGERSGRTVLPLVREFDNLIVLRSFEFWAGLAEYPVTVAFAAPVLMNELASTTGPFLFTPTACAALTASLDDLPYLEATLDELRIEKHRMHRMLRKSNVVRPFLSGAHHELVRIERGERQEIVAGLAARGITVHAPSQPGFEKHLRISALDPRSTRALQAALRQIGQGITTSSHDQSPFIASR